MGLLFHNIMFLGNRLYRLSLNAHSPEISQQIQNLPLTEDVTRYTSNLKQLKLSGMNVTHLFQPLSRVVNFNTLTHLGLSICDGAGHFISDLGITVRNRGLCLEHIAVIMHTRSGNEQQHLNEGIDHIFKACRSIKSLHAYYEDFSFPPRTIIDRILTTGWDLRLLGLHSIGDEWSLHADDFDKICRACPNLQQLGCQMDDISLIAPQGYET